MSLCDIICPVYKEGMRYDGITRSDICHYNRSLIAAYFSDYTFGKTIEMDYKTGYQQHNRFYRASVGKYRWWNRRNSSRFYYYQCLSDGRIWRTWNCFPVVHKILTVNDPTLKSTTFEDGASRD